MFTTGTVFKIRIPDQDRVTFLFGYRGEGLRYELHLTPRTSLAALYLVKGGIPLYLNHLRHDLPPGGSVELYWLPYGIKLAIAGRCIMCVNDSTLQQGRCRIRINSDKQVHVVTVGRSSEEQPEYLCLGDGFSNLRWRNRNYMCWPDLLFGIGKRYFNACSAAANSEQVLEYARSASTIIRPRSILLACGADDVIEGVPPKQTIAHIRQIRELFPFVEDGSFHLCLVIPIKGREDQVAKMNDQLLELATRERLGLINIASMTDLELASIQAEDSYPGPLFQTIMARNAACALQIDTVPSCPPFRRKAYSSSISRIWRKALRYANNRSLSFLMKHDGAPYEMLS